ncbi:Membrane insertase OXA1/ALB3/YidC [Corchorus capsularis]|uniref:Membrane insertase OXA1/ALB3/YidC n=1 Tax=Corchorus capsularis TaxID=210143 RepID=A0A1R3H1Q0_COCAP|nr:Membrane insertase OXA1/ALB3/YidC [Corchorus capsularis]
MAFRRSISTRATLLSRRFNPSISHIPQTNTDEETKPLPPNLSQSQSQSPSQSPIHKLLFHGSYNAINGHGYSSSRERTSSLFPGAIGVGLPSVRFMSTSTGDGSERIEDLDFVAEVVTEKAADALAAAPPVLSEVAVAAADSYLPVAALQHLIDAVHSFSGLNWWASIALTTLLIRGLTVPFLIDQLKASSRLSLLRPRLEELSREIRDKATDPQSLAEGQKQMKALFDEYKVSPFSPLKGLLIQGPIFISFFLAIRNMAEKVPSFKSGGALWFLDLTTPDSLYILPVLTALTFWITVECNMQEGLEGNPIAGTMKKYSRIFAAVSIPLMAAFPKALFCYCFTSNLFSLAYGAGLIKAHFCFSKFTNVSLLPKFGSPQYNAFSSVTLTIASRQHLSSRSTEIKYQMDPSI